MAKRDSRTSGAKPGRAAKSTAADAAAAEVRKRAKKTVKIEVQLADAREIRAAVDVLIDTLERKLAELKPDAHPAVTASAASAAAGKASTPAAGSASTPRRPARASAVTRRPRKPGPSARPAP